MHKFETHMKEKIKLSNINLNQIILDGVRDIRQTSLLTKKVIWLPGIKSLKKLWVIQPKS